MGRVAGRVVFHDVASGEALSLLVPARTYSVDAVALGRMQDAAVAEPERDVRRPRLSLLRVRDQVAAAELFVPDRRAGFLLLVCVTRNETSDASMCDMDEAGAIDAALRQATPEVRRAEQTARFFKGIAARAALEIVLSDPAWIVVGGSDPRPSVALLLDPDRLPTEEFGDALGVLLRLGADGGYIDRTEDVHGSRV